MPKIIIRQTELPEATAVLKDTSGTVLSSTSIPSGTSEDITAPNGTVNVQKSDSVLISAEVVKSNASVNYLVADSPVESSAAAYTSSVKATDTFIIPDVSWTDSDGSPQTSEYGTAIVCTTGTTLEGILYQRPQWREDATSYQTGDAGWLYAQGYYKFLGDPTNPQTIAKLDFDAVSPFLTLMENNLFGNLLRFTDETGAAVTGSNQFLLDHLTGIMYVDDEVGVQTWSDAVTNALASTQGGYTDWHLPTTEDIINTLGYGTAFNTLMAVGGGGTGAYTSTTRPSNTAQAYTYVPTTTADNYSAITKTNTRASIYCRAFYWDDVF